MATWQLQKAEAHLSEVIEQARVEGPQTIARDGTDRAVLLSIEDYLALVGGKPDFKAYLLSGPKIDSFDLGRSVDEDRDIAL